jgi:hypothetical protein
VVAGQEADEIRRGIDRPAIDSLHPGIVGASRAGLSVSEGSARGVLRGA